MRMEKVVQPTKLRAVYGNTLKVQIMESSLD
jgi:hypothetical protein